MTRRLAWLLVPLVLIFTWWSVLDQNIMNIKLQRTRPVEFSDLLHWAPDRSRLMGRLYLQVGDVSAAQPWLERGTLGRTAKLAYADLCLASWAQGEMELALSACQQGMVPAYFWVRRGLDLEAGGQIDQALRSYWMAILLDKDHRVRAEELLLGLMNRYAQDPLRLIDVLEPLLAQYPEAAPQGYQLLGLAYWHVNQREHALEIFLRGYELFPGSVAIQLEIAYIYLRDKNDLGQALIWYDRALAAAPNDLNAVQARAGVAVENQDWSLAIQLYERSTRLAPQTAWYWVQLGYAQQAAGSIDKAIAAYEQVLKLEPSNQEALKQLEILR